MKIDPRIFKLIIGDKAAVKLVRSLAFVEDIAEDRSLREIEVRPILVESGHFLFKQGEKPTPVMNIKALEIFGRTYISKPGVISDVPTYCYLRFGENTWDHVFTSIEKMDEFAALAQS